MKKLFFNILLISFFSTQAQAINVTPEYKNELMNRTPGLTSKGVSKRIARAMQYMARDNKKEAIEIMEKITQGSYRDFEMAKAWQTLAYFYAQTDNFKKARTAFAKALSYEALPYDPTLQSIFSLAQLEVVAEEYDKAEKTLKSWFALSQKPNPESYVFMATIDYNKERVDSALSNVTKAINMVKQPKENWLVFAVSLLYTKERYKEAAEYLYKLAEINHLKKAYWSQLAGSLISQDKGLLALSALKLALMMDLLTEEGEILNIASLYLSNDLPYEASQLLKIGIKNKKLKENKKNYELLSNCLIAAKEYDAALEPLEIAANKSSDGKLFALKARLYLEKEKFKTSIQYFDKAIKKGIKKDKLGKVLVEKAVAYIQLKDYKNALSVLDKAAKYEDAQEMASTWRTYIQSL